MYLKSIIILMFFILTTGCGSDSEKALKKGNKLLNSGLDEDRELSIEYFKKSIKLEVIARNQLARAYFKIAKSKMRKADKKLIEKEFNKKTKSLIKKQLGVAFTSIQLFNDAVKNFEEAAKIIPNDKFVRYYLGICYSQLSRSQKDDINASVFVNKAEESYRIALRLDPSFSKARYGLAMIYLSKKNYKESIKNLNQILLKEPKYIKAYFALGRIYHDSKEYAKAENMYRMLLEILPAKSYKRETVKQNIRTLEILKNR